MPRGINLEACTPRNPPSAAHVYYLNLYLFKLAGETGMLPNPAGSIDYFDRDQFASGEKGNLTSFPCKVQRSTQTNRAAS